MARLARLLLTDLQKKRHLGSTQRQWQSTRGKATESIAATMNRVQRTLLYVCRIPTKGLRTAAAAIGAQEGSRAELSAEEVAIVAIRRTLYIIAY